MFKPVTLLASALIIAPLSANIHADTLKLQLNHALPVIADPSLQTTKMLPNLNILDKISLINFPTTPAKPLDVATIEKYVGSKPQYQSDDNAYKVNSLRTDLHDIVGVNPKKLLSWAEFKNGDNKVQVTGMLIVTQNQINPMIDMLLKNNLSVIGLHDHVGKESPSILYLKFEGKGSEKQLATVVGKAFNMLKQGDKSESFPLAIVDAEYTTFNTRLVDHLMGGSGQMEEGVYKVHARQSKNCAAKAYSKVNFCGSNELAYVEGDILLTQENLKAILPILNQAGISIVSITERRPIKEDRIVQLHYYGVGKVAGLARGMRKALNVTTE